MDFLIFLRDTVKLPVNVLNLMTQINNQKILYIRTGIICMVMQSINFFSASGFKWIHPKEFDLNKCIINNHHGAEISVI